MDDRPLSLLGIARKGGNVAIGEEPVAAAAAGGKARLIILAADAASGTRRRAERFGALHGAPVITLRADKQMLGAWLGRGTVAIVAVTEIQLARAFLERLEPREDYADALQAVSRKAETMLRRKQKKPRDRKAGKPGSR